MPWVTDQALIKFVGLENKCRVCYGNSGVIQSGTNNLTVPRNVSVNLIEIKCNNQHFRQEMDDAATYDLTANNGPHMLRIVFDRIRITSIEDVPLNRLPDLSKVKLIISFSKHGEIKKNV